MKGRKEDACKKSDRAQWRWCIRCRAVKLRELRFGQFMLEVNAMCG